MSEEVDITLPKLGESIVSATVVSWLKKVGDTISRDEPLLEVATDKVNSEIPSPVEGILTEIVVEEREEVEVGGLLAKVTLSSNEAYVGDKLKINIASQHPPTLPSATKGTMAEMFSPAVLRLAQLEGISLDLLRQITGTGKEGRVSKKDLEEFIKNRKTPSALHEYRSQQGEAVLNEHCPCAAVSQSAMTETRFVQRSAEKSGLEERVELSGLRKAIADNMVRSFYEAPHASLVQEADVTEILALIASEKKRFYDAYGIKLTITSFLVYALSRTLMQYPMLNASLEDKTIVMKRYVNVGIAVNVPGGLIVPVIKHCQERNLVSIAKTIGEIAIKARKGKLSPDEVMDGTVTISNFGMAGALIGVPIIRYPEVAIVGVGTIQKRVIVREDDSIAIRKMLYLTLTFDHRVIDGIYGCEFLKTFKEHLESFPSTNM